MDKLEIGFKYDSGYESNVVIERKVPFNGVFIYEGDNGLYYYKNGECLNHLGDNEAHLQLEDDETEETEEMETYQVFKTVTTVTEYYTKAKNATQAEMNINDNNFHFEQLVTQTSEKKTRKFK